MSRQSNEIAQTNRGDPRPSSDPQSRPRSNWRWTKERTGQESTAKESDQDKLKKAERAKRFNSSLQNGGQGRDIYGFVSRGSESQLQHSEHAQRDFFDSILENFKASSAENQSLRWQAKPEDYINESGLASLLTNLRKLREALLHKTPDDFTKKVHMFSVRVSSAIGHFQTYVPSINYLTHDARHLLTEAEHREIITLKVLHMAHKNGANNRALEVFFEHLDSHRDSRVLATLVAWSLWDYNSWMSIYNSESDHAIYCAMSSGLPQMLKHMIECFGKSFFTYKKDDFMKFLPRGMSWADFQKEYGMSWTLENEVITLRRRNK